MKWDIFTIQCSISIVKTALQLNLELGVGGPYIVSQSPNPWDLRLETLDLDVNPWDLRLETLDLDLGLKIFQADLLVNL